MPDRPKLAVVYDQGSASPLEIAVAAADLCDIVFVVDTSAPTITASLPVLEQIGTIVPVDPAVPEITAGRLKELDVRAITCFTDAWLELTAELAERLRLRYHTPSVARLLTDKLRQRERLAARTAAAPRFARLSSAADIETALSTVGLPAVLKPRRSAGSRNTVPVDTAEEFLRAVAKLRAAGEDRLIVEERLIGDATIAGEGRGDYVSVESVVDDDRIVHVGITGKMPLVEPFREGGVFFPCALDTGVADRALAAAEEALRALGVRYGIAHTEFKLTADGPRLIEVNGRLGGFVNDVVGRSAGVNMVRLALANALGPGSPVPGRIVARCVAFQRFCQPPTWAASVAAVGGLRRAGSVPGIVRVEIVRRPGDRVDWRQGTVGFTAIVYGAAPDHETLDERLTALAGALRIEYLP